MPFGRYLDIATVEILDGFAAEHFIVRIKSERKISIARITPASSAAAKP
jgi:hypothetical protein